jgi:hypothetical protein
MSHFAKVLDGKVIQVIVAEQEFFNTFVDTSPGTWIQTSYNTKGNVYYKNSNDNVALDYEQTGDVFTVNNKTPLRGNFAGIGYIYDAINDVFYAPQPYASWTLNESTWLWDAPTPRPTDGKQYVWDEPTISWKELT